MSELLCTVVYTKEWVLFTRGRQPVAVLTPVDDLECLRAKEGQEIT